MGPGNNWDKCNILYTMLLLVTAKLKGYFDNFCLEIAFSWTAMYYSGTQHTEKYRALSYIDIIGI